MKETSGYHIIEDKPDNLWDKRGTELLSELSEIGD